MGEPAQELGVEETDVTLPCYTCVGVCFCAKLRLFLCLCVCMVVVGWGGVGGSKFVLSRI